PRKATEMESLPTETIIVTYRQDQKVVINDGVHEDPPPIPVTDLAKAIRERLKAKGGEKLVFVDFEDEVPWGDVVATMDKIRSISDEFATREEDKADNNVIK